MRAFVLILSETVFTSSRKYLSHYPINILFLNHEVGKRIIINGAFSLVVFNVAV